VELSGIDNYGEISRSLAGSNTAGASKKSQNGMDMTTFMQLLAAQFENQDIMNPTDNTQFISELAQFTSLQAMNTLTQYSDAQYAASLVGKTVQVYSFDNGGNKVVKQGIVQNADFTGSNGATITVDGTSYDLSAIQQVINPSAAPSTNNPANGSGTNSSGGSTDGSSGTSSGGSST
jgi:flagellar basal-body rod modification protein FlgD